MLLQCVPEDEAEVMLMTVCEYNIGRGDYYCRIASDPEADPWIVASTEMDAFVCGIGTPLLVSVEALGEGVTVYSSHGVVLEGDEYIPCSLAAPNEADEEDASWGSIRYVFLLTIIGSIQCPIFDLAVRKQGVYSGGEEAGPAGSEGNPSGARHGRRQQTRQHGTHVQLQGLHTRPAAGCGGEPGGFDEACELELINH